MRLTSVLLTTLMVAQDPTALRVLSAVGMRQAMLDLAPKFESATGQKLTISFDSVQATFLFSAAIMRGTADVNAAKAVIAFLRTPEAKAVIEASGMSVAAAPSRRLPPWPDIRR